MMSYAIQSHGVRDGKKFTNRDPQTYPTREEAQDVIDERIAEGSNNPNTEIVEVDDSESCSK